jgi:hypothetical protein
VAEDVAIALDTPLAVMDSVVFRELQGEAVILDMTNGVYFSLDAIGTRMWSVLVDRGTVAAAVERMREEYDVDEETLVRDLLALADELRARGLVRIVAIAD